MSIKIIAAVASNLCIGKDGMLPWHIPPDLKRFKSLTIGNIVLMGRKTFESLKSGPLKDRTNVILTRNNDFHPSGVLTAHSIEEALALSTQYDRDLFVIGGSEVYRQIMPFCDSLEITEVKKEYFGDTFFPEYRNRLWKESSRLTNPDYDFVTYQRI